MKNFSATVLQTGLSLSYQDSGRFGWRRYGVAPAGFMDPVSAQLANKLVANFANEVLLEVGCGGVRLKLGNGAWIAVCGAGESSFSQFYTAGEELVIPPFSNGLWAYIAIHGGWHTKEVFGSASYHQRSGLGEEIKEGSLLSASPQKDFPSVSRRYLKSEQLTSLQKNRIIRVSKGVHFDLFKNPQLLVDQSWLVSGLIDRTGYRLEGEPLLSSVTVKSLPVLAGCVQVTAAGQPIITMPDGPTVGGYPIVAIVHGDDLATLAQRNSGEKIQFEWYDID